MTRVLRGAREPLRFGLLPRAALALLPERIQTHHRGGAIRFRGTIRATLGLVGRLATQVPAQIALVVRHMVTRQLLQTSVLLDA